MSGMDRSAVRQSTGCTWLMRQLPMESCWALAGRPWIVRKRAGAFALFTLASFAGDGSCGGGSAAAGWKLSVPVSLRTAAFSSRRRIVRFASRVRVAPLRRWKPRGSGGRRQPTALLRLRRLRTAPSRAVGCVVTLLRNRRHPSMRSRVRASVLHSRKVPPVRSGRGSVTIPAYKPRRYAMVPERPVLRTGLSLVRWLRLPAALSLRRAWARVPALCRCAASSF